MHYLELTIAALFFWFWWREGLGTSLFGCVFLGGPVWLLADDWRQSWLIALLLFFLGGFLVTVYEMIFPPKSSDTNHHLVHDPMASKRAHYDRNGNITGYSDKD